MNWIVIYLILCVSPGSVIIASGEEALMINAKVLEGGGDGQCPSMEKRERARNEIHQIVDSAIANCILPITTTTVASTTTMPSTTTSAATMSTTDSTTTMPNTTSASTTTMPSTTILATTVSTMSMGTYTCNGTPEWRRVAFINMTDTSYNCPTGLNLTSYSKRTCGKSHTTAGCSSTTFSVGGLPYSHVCGRIRGYQFGATSAFPSGWGQDIDGYYVDGVSLTHGAAGRRQHIWTFAAGVTEVNSSFPEADCPCDTSNYDRVPNFVGNDYFCESGFHSVWNFGFVLYPDDVLWDGQNCTSTSTCCQLNNPPWFTKNLTNATTDDIELRICTNSHVAARDDVPIELIELYVQ